MEPAAYQHAIEAISEGEEGMHITCPHCQARALIRTSRPLTALVREAYCQCTNLACGHTFKIVVEAVQTLSPSAVPNQDPAIVAALGSKTLPPTPVRPAPALPPMP